MRYSKTLLTALAASVLMFTSCAVIASDSSAELSSAAAAQAETAAETPSETSLPTTTGKTVPEYTGDTHTTSDTPAEAQTEETSAEPSDTSDEAERLLAEMSLEEKVGQLFVIRPEQLSGSISEDGIENDYEDGMTAVSDGMAEVAEKYHIGGYALFARNIDTPEQLKKLTSDLREISDIPPMLLIDEEGGEISRIAGNVNFPDVPVYPNMHYIGSTGDTELAKQAGSSIGSYLAEYGFTCDLAPVADINSNPYNIVIGERAFGDDADTVSSMVSAFADGMHSAGMSCCLKHFPGHGDTAADTHDGYVSVSKSWEELCRLELRPFVENMDKADMIMTAHITLENVTDDGLPASLSKQLVTDKLRGELGYEGIIITDALAMGAVADNYGSATACVMALDAGNDILLMPENIKQAYAAVLDAVRNGSISEQRLDESVLRILKFKLGR